MNWMDALPFKEVGTIWIPESLSEELQVIGGVALPPVDLTRLGLPLYRQALAEKVKAMVRTSWTQADVMEEAIIQQLDRMRLLDGVMWNEVANADQLGAAFMRNPSMETFLHRTRIMVQLREIAPIPMTAKAFEERREMLSSWDLDIWAEAVRQTTTAIEAAA